ncbi:MAG: type II toxin-antitoxin system VapC family toxin [Deltaproteobacteria bacterium]|nr:type II toxin-antitoxin system VapC family toxin [Deltaproteobacteria bacterium]
MLAPDVNILAYAHRSEEKRHLAYRSWLENLVASPEPFGLSSLVAVGFVRIVTNSRIYATPTPLSLALAVIDGLVERRGCRIIGPTPEHWQCVSRLCREAGATGKLVADAQHAAIAIENGCRWVSRDRDFARFEGAGLRWTHLDLGDE